MYSSSDLRKGLRIEIDGVPYIITDFHFNKPGKGQACYICKLKNLINGSTLSKRFRPNEKIAKPEIAEKKVRYSYNDGHFYVFLDENYNELRISADELGDSRFFLVDDLEITVMIHGGKPIDIELPTFVVNQVIETEPGIRGNTATNVLKPATVVGGYVLQVPLFINAGDVLKIDTRTGKYMDRVRIAGS